LRAIAAEFIGTFALVWFGCGAIANGLPPTSVALAFGLVIAVMIYALGHLSGAHFNPAVSIGFAVGRHAPWSRVAGYIAAQVCGATVAALALRFTLGPAADLGVTRPAGSDLQSLAWEATLTFFLMFVITAVATDVRAVGQAAALAIGGTVALGALVGGPVSGASMNPARSIGPALVSGDLAQLWIYIAGPIAGAVAAALVYGWLRGGPDAPAGLAATPTRADDEPLRGERPAATSDEPGGALRRAAGSPGRRSAPG
jgi:aquaporin NIP